MVFLRGACLCLCHYSVVCAVSEEISDLSFGGFFEHFDVRQRDRVLYKLWHNPKVEPNFIRRPLRSSMEFEDQLLVFFFFHLLRCLDSLSKISVNMEGKKECIDAKVSPLF